MSQIEEVSLEKFKHLVSERALTGETTVSYTHLTLPTSDLV